MDRAHAATAYTRRITQLVADLANSGLEVQHPLLEGRDKVERAVLLVLTANRGLCGGYNGNVQRAGFTRFAELRSQVAEVSLEISGKRGIAAAKFRNIPVTQTYTHFEDKPSFEQVELLANRYLESYAAGQLDRLDVAYMRFENVSRQSALVETLLPLGALDGAPPDEQKAQSQYEFLPSAESILEEVVPTSFKVKLFKCFLDAAVSEQVARMIAMKAATKSAGDRIRQLSMAYNRARQSQITGEIMEIIGGVEALKG
jgi:F-type H+-transporting ATPase subunit gamma